jgi:thiol-disulfide isomerase/thioredoxin
MKTIRIGITTIALLLAAAFVFAACSGSAPQTTEAPAAQTQQTNAVPAAPAPQQAQAATATSVPPTQPPAATATTVPSKPVATAEPQASAHASIVTPTTGDEKTVPEIRGIASWINSEPITFEEQRGKVVLVDFWTYTCVNCIRTLPFLKAWHEKYADKGLVIVGVHTPEFDFEKDRDNVIEATEGFGLKWPIAQDNDFKTWRAFDNRYWPAKYLVDKDGLIRYTHFGEGAYEETELWIRGLLEEAGVDLSDVSASTLPEPQHVTDQRAMDRETGLTREIYAGFERNYSALLSSAPYVLHQEYYEEEDAEILYTDPGEYRNHFLYLQGLWRNEAERLVHARETENFEDYLALRFYATSVNAVMAPVNGGEYQVRVTLNDEPITPDAAGTDVMFDADGNGYIVVDSARMYHVVNLPKYESHELKLSSNSPEFSLFAYTFGAYDGGEPAQTGPTNGG